MEDLAPPMVCSITIKLALQNGDSFRKALPSYVSRGEGGFEQKVSELILAYDQGNKPGEFFKMESRPYRRSLLELCWLGLSGESVLDRLIELEKEIEWSCEQELEGFFRVLPIKSMIPVMLFQVPAFLILLFGPILQNFMEGMK